MMLSAGKRRPPRFLITGACTSVGAVSGMLVLARWRIVALVIGTLLLTAVVTGWLAGLWL